jgi:hypothetical protein
LAFPATSESTTMNALNTIMTILKLLPAIVAAVKALEEALPTAGAGKDKLAALREIVVGIDASITSIWPAVETTVAAVVRLMNKGKEVQQ